MSTDKELLKNYVIYIIGNFGSKLLSFFLLPLYTYYLSTKDYGYFDLIITTLTLLLPIITMQIYDGIYREILSEKNIEIKKAVITTGAYIIVRNIIIFSIIYLIMVKFIKFEYSNLILVQFMTSTLNSLTTQISRGLKKNLEYSIAGMISTGITLSSNIVFIALIKWGVSGLIISYILGNIISSIYLIIKVKIYNYIDIKLINKNLRFQLYKYSIPLIFYNLSWWVMSVSDRYMINKFINVEANGMYAIANKFPSLIFMLISIFNLAWQDVVFKEESEDYIESYSKTFNRIMKLQFTTLFILLSITQILFKILINEKFYEAYNYVPFLYIASIISTFTSFYNSIYLKIKNTNKSLYTSLLGCIINIFINLILIKKFGVIIAAISTMVAYIGTWIFQIIDTRKIIKININLKLLLKYIYITIIYTIIYYCNIGIFIIITILGAIFMFFYYNKDLIYMLSSFLFEKVNLIIKRRKKDENCSY